MIIVFDIGGTNMRVAAVNGEELGEIKKIPTPQDPKEAISSFVALAKELAGGAKIDAVGGDIPGTVDADGVVSGGRNIKAWKGTNIVSAISEALGAPTKVVNDCELIGLGEAYKGAGKDASVLAYVTVSTGVGAAKIVNQAIDYEASSFIFGGVSLDGVELEDLISGTAVRRKFGIEPKELESVEERNELADIFARGLVMLIEKWKPDTIVIGGSMIIGVNPIPLGRMNETLATLISDVPRIKMAELGDNGGLYGGMILAQQV